MRRSDRMAAILDALRDERSIRVGELAARFDVSEATVRRDLAQLEEQRLLTRTHGGARTQEVASELPVRYRDSRQPEAKRALARLAVRRLPSGPHVVGLTGGTTMSEVARQLSDRTELTVVTNALNIAMDLVMRPRVKLVVVGGVSRPQSYELVGPWAEEVIASVNIGTAFVGADGVAAVGGLTTHDEVEARTNRAMISRARRVIVVADGTKIGQVMLARIVDLDVVHELITDGSADPDALDAVRRLGVPVTVAELPSGR